MKIELRKSTFGFNQDCKLEVVNKMDGVHITVIESEHPTLIDIDVIAHMVNAHKPPYQEWAGKYNLSDIANGWLADEIKRAENELESMKFAQKLAKRKKLFVHLNGEIGE